MGAVAVDREGVPEARDGGFLDALELIHGNEAGALGGDGREGGRRRRGRFGGGDCRGTH